MSKQNIYNRLMDKINNPYGVIGLMCNIRAESNFNSMNMQNSYEAKLGFTDTTYTQAVDNGKYQNFSTDRVGYGLCQWTSSGRKQSLLNYARSVNKSIGDENMQIDYLIVELTNTYKEVMKVLQSATAIKEASDYVMLKFERPANQSEANLAKRASYGDDLWKELVKEKTMGSNSKLVSYTQISPNKNSPRNHVIDTITIHCFVGQVSVESGCAVFANKSRQASCNYVIARDGKIGLVVDEKDRSWCSSNKANDHRAITIEVASDTLSPYAVTDKALEALIQLCADICKRNNIPKLVWSTNKSDRVNHKNGCNMTVHRDFANKACPGDYLYSMHGYIADEVNKLLGIKVEKKVVENPYTVPTRTLKKKLILMRGDDVKWVQWYLVKFGFLQEKDIDGLFGNNTKNAVIKAQKKFLLDQDGIVGKKTISAFLNF